ncbi:hypothetical protein ABS71_18865 [bacterium SCN 62-11]|nr:MAG: hypothetical protein ABS71_18865 [bacterium SCN 62-11]
MEILMGMALMALILVAALCVLQWALLGSTRQQAQTRAAFLAQQQMEALCAADQPQSAQGTFESGFTWSAQVKPVQDFLALEVRVKGPAGSLYTLTTERRKELNQLVFRSDGQKLFQTAEDVPEPIAVSDGIAGDFCLSPDGQQLAYVASHEGKPQIFLRRLDSKNAPQLLINHPEGAGEPRFSPDGEQLAFTSQANGASQVFVYSVSRRSFRNASNNSHQENSPGWFPDSQSLLVCRDGSSIVKRLANGSEQVLVAESEGWNAAPCTDGKTLVFMSSRDGNPEIYSLNLDSKKLRRLTEDPAYDTTPQLKGQRILFQSNRDGVQRLYSMNLDGSELTPVTPDQAAEAPQWTR